MKIVSGLPTRETAPLQQWYVLKFRLGGVHPVIAVVHNDDYPDVAELDQASVLYGPSNYSDAIEFMNDVYPETL